MTPASLTIWLPTDPPRPCPEVLTEDEAIAYLRLDTLGIDAVRSLKEYRGDGRLRAVRVGRRLMYRRADLERFLDTQQETIK